MNLKKVEICENQGGALGKFSDFLLRPEQIFQGSPLGFHKFQLSSNALKIRYRGKSRSLITNLMSVSTSHGRIYRNPTDFPGSTTFTGVLLSRDTVTNVPVPAQRTTLQPSRWVMAAFHSCLPIPRPRKAVFTKKTPM